MADFEIIEADFQQYYQLDVSTLKFRRFARLLKNLPAEARWIQAHAPLKDWNWDREMQTHILHSIDTLGVMFANANRKKGTKRAKVPPPLRPDYVTKGTKSLNQKKREDNKAKSEELARFFEKREAQMKKIEEATTDGA